MILVSLAWLVDWRLVLDIGCNNCRFLRLLTAQPGLQLVAGLDIDREELEEAANRLGPLPADWLNRRPRPLEVMTISFTSQSLSNSDIPAAGGSLVR